MQTPILTILRTDLGTLILLALARLFLHVLTNAEYGFHRDELAFLDDARHLDWGYVSYPPVTPFIGRIALELFGPSLIGVRFFSAVAQSITLVLAGLMARDLGASRRAQIVAALAVAIAPMSLLQGALFQYVSFDYFWWVLIAFLAIRLLKSQEPRWWLAIGAAIGLGMMTKYTLAFFIAGLAGGVLFTGARRYLSSPWLWGGVALSLLFFAPNLLWQIQHDFISLEFLSSIRARDIASGRTDDFLVEQLYVAANPVTIPLWLAGLYFYFGSPTDARYRMLGWMFVIPFGLFLVMQGRGYYLAPAYPMLIAAGVVVWDRWLATLTESRSAHIQNITWGMLIGGALTVAPAMLPVAPINSSLWRITSDIHDNFVEQIGWPELAETVAQIYLNLPVEDLPRTAILAGNHGVAGALNLYGPAHGLPPVISSVNTHWLRGYGEPPPEMLILVGFTRESAERYFAECHTAGLVTNRYGVENEEIRYRPEIFLCQNPREPWPDLWHKLQRFT